MNALADRTMIAVEPLTGAADALVRQVQRSLAVLHNGQHGIGAGIVWASDNRGAYVLTNHHVVAHGRARGGAHGRMPEGTLRAALADEQEYPARLLAQDEEIDLALLHIEAPGAPAAPIGASRDLRIGQLVMAVGHPWGQRGVVTLGLVSGLLKAHTQGPRGNVDVIRSDARLAPGNSGGPLVNAAGEVVGINTMIVGGDQGIALAAHVAAEFVAAHV